MPREEKDYAQRKLLILISVTILLSGILYISDDFLRDSASSFSGRDIVTGFSTNIAPSSSSGLDRSITDIAQNSERVDVVISLENRSDAMPFGAARVPSHSSATEAREMAMDKIGDEKIRHRFSSSDAFSASLTLDEIEELQKEFDVNIRYDYPVRTLLDESVPLIEADDVWDVSLDGGKLDGRGKAVCVVDTGVDYTHPDLGGCTYEELIAGNCSGVVDGYDVAENNDDPMDVADHGTHVAGIVSTSGTMDGVAPGTPIVAIKVFGDDGYSSSADVVAGIEKCTEKAQESGKDYDIVAMTLSLGLGSSEDPILETGLCDADYPDMASAIDAATSAGISVTVATGNDGNDDRIGVPACIENSIRVASTTADDEISSFSDRNDLVNLTAPGDNIYSTVPGDGYAIKSGTSMATPHVAGTIAIMNQYLSNESRSLQPKELENVLYRTGVNVDDESYSGRNFSRISVFDAILEIDTTSPELDISTDQPSTFHYSDGVNISWSATDIVALNTSLFNVTYPDGSLLYESEVPVSNIGIDSDEFTTSGIYLVELSAEDNSSNTAYHNTTFNVTDVPQPNMTLMINGSESDAEMNNSGSALIEGELLDGEKDLELFINQEFIAKGDPNVSSVYNFTSSDIYDITLRHNESENFFHKNLTRQVFVYNTTPQIDQFFPENLNTALSRDESVVFSQNSSDDQGLPLTFSWYIDEEYVTSSESLEQVANDLDLGDYNITFMVNNTVENNSVSWNLTVEPLPINVNITSPEDKAYNTSTVPLDLSLTNDFDLDSCWYEVNGTNNTEIPDCSSADIFELDDGNYNLTVYTNDTLGEIFNSSTSFTIDTSVPSINLSGIPEDEFIAKDKGFVMDADFGISGEGSLDYDIGSGWINITPEEYFFPFNSTDETSNKSIRFRAKDSAGNINVSDLYNYTIDLTPPSITLNDNLPDIVNGTIFLNFTIEELVSDSLANISYQINEREPVILNSSIEAVKEYTFDHEFNLSTGVNDINIYSYDWLGNRAHHKLMVRSSGEVDIDAQKTQLNTLTNYTTTFMYRNGTEIEGVKHSDILDDIDIIFTLNSSINFTGVDATRTRWENKSISIADSDDIIGNNISAHSDNITELLKVENQDGFFGESSFDFARIDTDANASDVNFVYYIPDTTNISDIEPIPQCSGNEFIEGSSSLPCFTNITHIDVYVDGFSAVVAGIDNKPPEVMIDVSDTPDWGFTPQIIVSDDVVDEDDISMNYRGDEENAVSLVVFNSTHRIAQFEEKFEEHDTKLNLSFSAYDNVGNLNDTEWKNITINDTVAPEVTLDHSDSISTKNDRVKINLSLDKTGTVTYYNYDNDAEGDCFTEDMEGSCIVSLADGRNSIDIIAANPAGVEDFTVVDVDLDDGEDDLDSENLLDDMLNDTGEDEDDETDGDDKEEDVNTTGHENDVVAPDNNYVFDFSQVTDIIEIYLTKSDILQRIYASFNGTYDDVSVDVSEFYNSQHLNTYLVFEIKVANLDSASLISAINFSVNASWIREQEISPSAIVMYKEVDGNWLALSTDQMSKTEDTYEFFAMANGLEGRYRVGFESKDISTDDDYDVIGTIQDNLFLILGTFGVIISLTLIIVAYKHYENKKVRKSPMSYLSSAYKEPLMDDYAPETFSEWEKISNIKEKRNAKSPEAKTKYKKKEKEDSKKTNKRKSKDGKKRR